MPLCDMGAKNVKTLKLFGVSEKTPICRFCDQETAAVFDPPHLLKYTCKLCLKHNVANVECEITVNGERLTGTGKWDDFLKLYEVDKRNVVASLSRSLGSCSHRQYRPNRQTDEQYLATLNMDG